MSYEPKPGDVICYDFLWKEEEQQGRYHGAKDRPCAIIITTEPKDDGSVRVVVAAITHTAPSSFSDNGIEMPIPVARHLGLDSEDSWIKTHQVNVFTWPKNQLPFGVIPVKDGKYTYGSLPDALIKKIVSEISENAASIPTVDRDKNEK